jgi:hypothetical protein
LNQKKELLLWKLCDLLPAKILIRILSPPTILKYLAYRFHDPTDELDWESMKK